MWTKTLFCVFLILAISSLQAKRFTDAEKKLRAQQSIEKSQRTWLGLYKYNKGENGNSKNLVQNAVPNLPVKKPAVQSGQQTTVAVGDNPNTNTNANAQPLKPSAAKKPGRVISKNPREEKQKHER